jgi:hypothetical protein
MVDDWLEADFESKVTGDIDDVQDGISMPFHPFHRCDRCGDELGENEDELCGDCEARCEAEDRVNETDSDYFHARYDDDPSPYSGTFSEE